MPRLLRSISRVSVRQNESIRANTYVLINANTCALRYASRAHSRSVLHRVVQSESSALVRYVLCQMADRSIRILRHSGLQQRRRAVIDPASMSDVWNYGEDPKKYPYETARLRRVIETAAREAGWGRKLPPGRGLGIAAHRSFVSYTAVVVEVSVDASGKLSIPKVDIAFDCGVPINPNRVRAQLEGAVVQGVSLATLGEITFKAGSVQ